MVDAHTHTKLSHTRATRFRSTRICPGRAHFLGNAHLKPVFSDTDISSRPEVPNPHVIVGAAVWMHQARLLRFSAAVFH